MSSLPRNASGTSATDGGRFFYDGLCGEHGGDPDSIDFFDRIGLDYVSCSPSRLPIARLAAVQATPRQSSQ